MGFLPENYEAPKSSSSYMRLEDGESRIRILSDAIIGWEDWKDKKPMRFRFDKKPERAVDPMKKVKHFMDFIVWNYKEERIQILHITQVAIHRVLETLYKDKEWGSPHGYDLKIIRSGKDEQTKYSVTPSPKREIDQSVKDAFIALPINLEELYSNGDPFNSANGRTRGFWEMNTLSGALVGEEELISKTQEAEIEASIAIHVTPAAPEWRRDALKALKIDSFAQLKRKYLGLVFKRIEEKRQALVAKEIEELPF